MGVGSGGQGGPWPPWIFIDGTDIVHKGLTVLFLGLFCYFLVFFLFRPPWKSFNSAIFRSFFRCPPEKFSADVLVICVKILGAKRMGGIMKARRLVHTHEAYTHKHFFRI